MDRDVISTAVPAGPTEFPPQLVDRFRVFQHQATVSIALCVHDGLDDVKRCLSSLIEYTYPPLEIVLVDNGSEPATREYLDRFARQQAAILIRNETAQGYAAAANQAIRASHAEYVVLLHSNTVVTGHWIDRMVMCASSDARIGLVGPLSSALPELAAHAEETVDISRLAARSSGRLYPRVPFLNGSCLLIKRALLDAVGLFDEVAPGDSDAVDGDFCKRALAAGWQAAVSDDTYVFHAPAGNRAPADDPAPAADLHDLVWCGLRARAQEMFPRQELRREGRLHWEGRRVAIFLPARKSSSSLNRLLGEARAMQGFGVDVALVNLKGQPSCFVAADPDLDPPELWVDSLEEVPAAVQSFDAVVATDHENARWLSAPGTAILAYYLLDFEERSLETLAPGMKLFSATGWRLEEVRDRMGQLPAVIGPSVDVDLFRPRVRRASGDRLNLYAMLRPASAGMVQALRDLGRTFHERIHIHVCLVGKDTSGGTLSSDFAFHQYEAVAPQAMSQFLSRQDILIDASFDAFGQAAMDAMAAGVAVIAPAAGSAGSPAMNEENALLLAPADAEGYYRAAVRLIEDRALRERLQRRATIDLARFHPERAAGKVLELLFPEL